MERHRLKLCRPQNVGVLGPGRMMSILKFLAIDSWGLGPRNKMSKVCCSCVLATLISKADSIKPRDQKPTTSAGRAFGMSSTQGYVNGLTVLGWVGELYAKQACRNGALAQPKGTRGSHAEFTQTHLESDLGWPNPESPVYSNNRPCISKQDRVHIRQHPGR